MNQLYSFKTTWIYPFPVEKIWPIIKDIKTWPTWWKGVNDVEIISNGMESGLGKKVSLTWKSKLPYKLAFDMEVTAIDYLKKITGHTTGELVGIGVWEFEQREKFTYLIFYWDVVTTKRWMNLLAPILRPAFKWNHNLIMEWGRVGLGTRLEQKS